MCKLRHVFCVIFVVGAVSLLFGTKAFAQQEPLRLAFVNASKSGGGDAFDLIEQFLEASDDIQVLNSDRVWDEASDVGVSKTDFRSGSRRKESSQEFRTVMKNLGIESILIQDVYSRGRKFQLVVIGPDGTEVADIRKDIRRGRISKDQARDVLKQAFGQLVPEVKAFRDNGGWDAYAEPEPEPEPEPEEDLDPFAPEEDEDDEDETPTVPGEYGLASGYTLNFGALVGSRDFALEGAAAEDGRFQLDHKSPWVGLFVQIDAVFAVLGEGNSAIGASLFGGYAPFTTIFDGDQEFASDFARLGGQLVYIYAIDENIAIDIFAGVETRSITIEQNENYTGDKYLGARAGARGSYTSGVLSIGAGAAVLPTFSINNSNGAYGEADGLALGLEGKADLGFQVTDGINVSIGYLFQTISVDFVDPIRPGVGEPVSTSDTIHSGMVTVGYTL